MSREIKFRAWSNEHNRYCDLVTLDEIGRWIGWIKSSGVYLTTPDIVLEQYTGLKDKNGKEIYEGDVVRRVCQIGYGINDKRVEYPVNGRPVLIKWNKEGCGWSYFLNGCGLCRKMGWASPDEVEVVGKIHENPELLGGEE